jgi:hypothetical protein
VRGNPHAAFDVAGAGNVAWSRWCDTRRRKGETTGNTNFDLHRRASPRPYLREAGGEIPRPTHLFICSKTRRGKFQIKRKSRRDRMREKLQAIKQELRRRMHQPIPEQGKWLKQVVTGYFNYHAVPTNGPTLIAFRFHVTNLWRRTLRRRSQKDWTTKERTTRSANDWLPKPRILHPWPDARFAVRHHVPAPR